jgi:predicted anti-sigma-YlaC factor YlaD
MRANVHDAVDELLPWYANGTLEGEERDRVERHLAECEVCREEMALLRNVDHVRSEMVAATPIVPDALGKTLARIDEWEHTRRPSLAARVRAFAARVFDVPTVPRLVLVAQFALILVLGSGLVLSRLKEPTITTLSGGSGASAAPRLTVVFEATATEESIRQALQKVGGTLVSGPSAAGVYLVALPKAGDDAKAVDAAIAALRENRSVIRFVELEP